MRDARKYTVKFNLCIFTSKISCITEVCNKDNLKDLCFVLSLNQSLTKNNNHMKAALRMKTHVINVVLFKPF
jgi:hypothetical protein